MFVKGMGVLGDYVNRPWKVEDWWKPTASATEAVIPGVSNTTAAVAGGAVGLAALAGLAWWLWGRK